MFKPGEKYKDTSGPRMFKSPVPLDTPTINKKKTIIIKKT